MDATIARVRGGDVPEYQRDNDIEDLSTYCA